MVQDEGQVIELTRAQWNAIHRDYKGKLTDGSLSAFAGALPRGLTKETGTTLVTVRIKEPA